MVEVEQIVAGAAVLGLLAIGAYLTYRGLGSLQNGWTIWRNDPVSAGGVRHEEGVVEVQGKVEQLEEELLTTEYTDTPTVAYDYKLREKRKNPATDDREWKTVESGTETQPFYVTDETGSVAVDPDGATVSLDTEKISGGHEVELGPVDASTGKRYEGRLVPGDHVHVYGQKRAAHGDGPGGEQVYIGDGGQTDTFSISDTTEARTSLRYLGKGVVGLLVGLVALGASGFLSLVLLGQLEVADLGVLWLVPLALPGL
jgi:hypothetical protein